MIGILGRGILEAIQANELERAAQLIAAAERTQANVDFAGRANIVTEITRAIAAAKRAKDAALSAAAALPGVSQLDLELRVIGPLDRLLERGIDKMRAERRRVSRPT